MIVKGLIRKKLAFTYLFLCTELNLLKLLHLWKWLKNFIKDIDSNLHAHS